MGAYEDWLLGVQTSGVNTTPGSTVSTGKVYLGGTKTSYNGNMLQTVDNTANVIDKINEFYTWNEAQRNAFEAKLRKKNYIGPKEKIDPGRWLVFGQQQSMRHLSFIVLQAVRIR